MSTILTAVSMSEAVVYLGGIACAWYWGTRRSKAIRPPKHQSLEDRLQRPDSAPADEATQALLVKSVISRLSVPLLKTLKNNWEPFYDKERLTVKWQVEIVEAFLTKLLKAVPFALKIYYLDPGKSFENATFNIERPWAALNWVERHLASEGAAYSFQELRTIYLLCLELELIEPAASLLPDSEVINSKVLGQEQSMGTRDSIVQMILHTPESQGAPFRMVLLRSTKLSKPLYNLTQIGEGYDTITSVLSEGGKYSTTSSWLKRFRHLVE